MVTSKTVLAGEKYLAVKYYTTEVRDDVCVDNNSAYQGYDWDVIRWGNSTSTAYRPLKDTEGDINCSRQFGSAHTAGFHVVNVDNSVHALDYGIDLLVWEYLCSRRDGQTAPTQ